MENYVKTPGQAIQDALDERGWTHNDLAQILGRHRPEITDLVSGKRGITPAVAVALGAALGCPPEYWLAIDAKYRLSRTQHDADVSVRARIFALAPVKDMQRRGWIKPTKQTSELERELCRFYGISSIEDSPSLMVATRRSQPMEQLSPAQLVWCVRAKNLAREIIVGPFVKARIDKCEAELKKLMAYAASTPRISRTLSGYGIRFVVVQPLPGSRIDGAAMWIDEDKPVIALSLRMNRIDSFWFTLLHEFSHIRHGDGLSIDSDLTGEFAAPALDKVPFEQRADEEAAMGLVPQDKMESFISRIAPMYSKGRIVQFAHRMKVHPGIIVGQLQHRGEIAFSYNREMLVKVRQKVISTSVVDGWGSIPS